MYNNIIYGLVDPITGHLKYVGQSRQGLRRPRQHMERWQMRDTYKDRWILKLKKDNQSPLIVVIQEFDVPDDLNKAECFWISYFIKMGFKLTNLTGGGDAIGSPSRASLIKLSRALGGRAIVDHLGNEYELVKDVAQKLNVTTGAIRACAERRSLSCNNIIFRYKDDASDIKEALETMLLINNRPNRIKQLLQNGMTYAEIGKGEGISPTAVHAWVKKLKLKANKRRPMTEENRILTSRKNGNPPVIDNNGIIYPSQAAAAKALGLRPSDVSALVCGRQKTAKGYSIKKYFSPKENRKTENDITNRVKEAP